MAKPDYDTSLARIAGNICSGLITPEQVAIMNNAPSYARREWVQSLSVLSVEFACQIVEILRSKAEYERQNPPGDAK